MGRTIIVGDVHGCREELEALLDRVAFTVNDRLVLVGDLVARGPDSKGVIGIARRTKAQVIRGNHEEKLIVWHAEQTNRTSDAKKRPQETLSAMHLAIAKSLDDDDWALIEATPLWGSLPEHETLVIHAGLLPGIPLEEQQRKTLLHIRAIGPKGQASDEKGKGPLWGERYVGPPHIVFGHNAMDTPQFHPWATGIDTACVYGGRLTALVLSAGQAPPRGKEVIECLVSEPAREIHYSWARKRPGAATRDR